MSTRKNTSVKELTNNVFKLIKYKTGIEKPPRSTRKRNIGLIISGAASMISLGVVSILLNEKLSKTDRASQNARFNISNPPASSGTTGTSGSAKTSKPKETKTTKEK